MTALNFAHVQKRVSKRKLGYASSAEFGPALIVLFLVILFPLINLISIATGASTIYFLSKESASKASNSTTYADALRAAEQVANRIASSGFGKFAKLQPVAGYNGSGIDLYVSDTNINSQNTTSYGPNTPPPIAINTNTNLYTYDVRATYDMGPFVNMGAVPFVKDIPGVGKPARMSFLASSSAEHPEGIGPGAASTAAAPPGGIGAKPPGGGGTVAPPIVSGPPTPIGIGNGLPGGVGTVPPPSPPGGIGTVPPPGGGGPPGGDPNVTPPGGGTNGSNF